MKVTGQCHCGQITFTAEIDPSRVRVCHCTDCQMQSGSAFRTNVPVVDGTFVLKGRAPTIYVKTADSGNRRAYAFCPECGTPIYSAGLGDPPPYSLRVGTLDRRAELLPARQIWCRSALPWSMDLTQLERIERQ
ncbi:MAG: GFA family protein [Stellaceae bacterium]